MTATSTTSTTSIETEAETKDIAHLEKKVPQGPKQISLEDLGKLEVPYGKNKIFKAYKDANFLDRRDASINERVWSTHFYPLATGAQKDRPRPITKEVGGIYRLKHKGKEFLMYHATFRGTDWKKNPIDFSLLMGRYEIPEFQYEVDPHTDEIIPGKTQVRNHSTHYDIEFTKAKALELIKMGIETLFFVIIDSTGKKYSCSLDEFVNMDHDELVNLKSGFAKYIEDRRKQQP